MEKKLYIRCLLLGLALQAVPVLAQQERYTEEEVFIEKDFIEAQGLHLQGKLEEAARKFREVLERDRRNAAVYFELARIEQKLEQPEKALQSIDQAIRFEPANSWYLLLKADLLEEAGRYVQAAEVYDDLIGLQPEEVTYYYEKVGNHMRIGQADEALATLDLLKQKVGSFEELHQRKYDIYRNLGRLDAANEEVRSLLKLYPANTDYIYMMASYYRQSGKQAAADSLFRRILEIDPGDARAGIALAKQLKAEGHDVTYLRSLREILDNPQADLDAKIMELIPVIGKTEDDTTGELTNEVLRIIDRLEKIHGSDAKLSAIRGDVLQFSGDPKQAIAAYQAAIRRNNGIYAVWEQLMRLQYQQHDYEGLLRSSEEALDVFPNQVRIWIFNGQAASGLRRYSAALSSFEQALMIAGNKAVLKQEILMNKGITAYRQGKPQEGAGFFEEAIPLGENPLVLQQYTWWLSRDSRTLAQAADLAGKAYKRTPGDPFAVMGWAQVLYRKESYAEARTTVESYLSSVQDRPYMLLDLLGDILLRLQDTEGAVTQWKAALRAGGPVTELERKIKDKKTYE